MEIYISNSGGEPIYAQIVRQIKNAVLTDRLQEGDALPSIRLLAKELRISVITTKRAYEELEREGYIFTRPGRGSFVAPHNTQLRHEEALKQMESYLQQAVEAARLGGVSDEEMTETLRILLDGE